MSPTSTPKGAASLRADDVKPEALTKGPKSRTGGLASWVDDRTSAARVTSRTPTARIARIQRPASGELRPPRIMRAIATDAFT